jgi:mycothiol synthase
VNVREFTDGDADAVAALIGADEEHFFRRPSRLQGADILRFRKHSKEAWVWDDGGTILAAATYGIHGDIATVRGTVATKHCGIGTELVLRGEAFARRHGLGRIHAGAPEPDAAARALLEGRGYREVRRFYEMAVELEEEPVVPDLRDGLVLDEVRDGEERAFYDALNDAFQDHWEWHPMPFDEWIEMRRDQHHDEHGPVWFVVRDGGELAAVTRNDVDFAGGGYVGAIGVRPAWRGRGLAKALLQRTFLEVWRRGSRRVTLDVDAQNPTGATHLYERVGMRVEKCDVAFEKLND